MKTVKNTSKVMSIILFILNYFLNLYLNSILSFIRTISMIVHLLSIKLNCPDTTTILFSELFEIVSFDFLPTKDFYEEIFNFDNVPISESLDIMGYASQYIIINLGTVFIMMMVQIIVRILILMLKKIAPKNKKL